MSPFDSSSMGGASGKERKNTSRPVAARDATELATAGARTRNRHDIRAGEAAESAVGEGRVGVVKIKKTSQHIRIYAGAR